MHSPSPSPSQFPAFGHSSDSSGSSAVNPESVLDPLSHSARQQARIKELHTLLTSVGTALRRSEHELAEMKHHCQILEERERVLTQKLELSESERISLAARLELLDSDLSALRVDLLQQADELTHARSSLSELQQITPTSLLPETNSDLEQQLRDSRLEADQLREQLFLCEEELEYYFLLSQGQLSDLERSALPESSSLMASGQANVVINSSRNRLLASI